MYQFKTGLVILLAMLSFLLSGCNEKPQNKESQFTQKVSESLYQNHYFDFTVQLPEGWYAQQYDEAKQLTDRGGEMMAGDDKELKAVIDAAEAVSVNLFGFFEHPVGAAVPFNPSVLAMAENVKAIPGIKRGTDYFYHAKKLMERGAIKYTFAENYSTRKIGDVEFDQMSATAMLGNMQIQQDYYTAIYKGYAIIFIQTYKDNPGKDKTSTVLNSIETTWE